MRKEVEKSLRKKYQSIKQSTKSSLCFMFKSLSLFCVYVYILQQKTLVNRPN